MLKIFIYFLVSANLAQSISEHPNFQLYQLWKAVPLFFNTSHSSLECKNSWASVLERADNGELNALKMLDATAKLPAGILSGNIVQYGDYDECLGVPNSQYCLIELDPGPIWNNYNSSFVLLKPLIHSHFMFRNKFQDPAHRVPGFSTFRWGFCIPDKCSDNELKQSVAENLGLKVGIRPGMCQRNNDKYDKKLSIGEKFTRISFGFLALIVILSSAIDYISTSRLAEGKETLSLLLNKFVVPPNKAVKLLMGFSIKQNLSKLFRIEYDKNEIEGLHCIRSLNAFALFLSHKSISLLYNPYINRTDTVEGFSQPWTIIAKNAIIYTDCFLLISGLLNANALLRDLSKKKSMEVRAKLITRLFRILPSLIALILFCTYILPLLGSGPLWPTVIDHHATLCKKYMWRNLFFIHNYFGFENICLTHTHQLGIDMQLFLMTPIIIYLITSVKYGMKLMLILALGSSVLRFYATYQYELSSIVHSGITISRMFDTANYSYILPTHRFTIYFIGIYLAVILKNTTQQKWSLLKETILWIVFIVTFFGTWLGPFEMATNRFVYNKLNAAFIAALTPITWGSAIAFGIFTLNRNKSMAGFLAAFFGWKYFQVSTRIAYSLYLVQFPIFFYNVGSVRSATLYTTNNLLSVLDMAPVLLASIALTVLIEMPFQNVKRVLLDAKEDKNQVGHIILRKKTKMG